jgi:dTDP-glucose 4,6-dehydratase
MKKVLVTGGAGFIGSNFVKYMLAKYPEYTIYNLDALTYAGNLETLKDIEENPGYKFIKGDIRDKAIVEELYKSGIDLVVNFAAESHVDRSILGPEIFTETNVLGTQVLLDLARKYWQDSSEKRFLQVSTDEVYGSLGSEGFFAEDTPLAPNSPYSASKASADLICRAYFKTFNFPVLITRCSNNYGPYQFPEKLIPLIISNALADKQLPVYGDGKNVRDWLYVEDHCEAIATVLHQGKPGQIYNVGGKNEWQNIDIVKLILQELNKPESLIEYVKDRLGHDRRYAIDPKKIEAELGWQPKYKFEDGIKATIKWYLDNLSWIENVKSGEYQNYYQQQYAGR